MPPKAKAKGVAAKAQAKAAFAGKAKAQSAGLGKGGGAGPQGTLRPSGPAPVATRRWVHCGWDADYYDNEVALAAPGELVEGDLLSALHYFAPSIRGCLNASWRIHSAWSRQELPARCFQLTQDMAYALSELALHWQVGRHECRDFDRIRLLTSRRRIAAAARRRHQMEYTAAGMLKKPTLEQTTWPP